MADDEGNGVGDNPPTRGVSMSSTDPVIDNSRRKLSKKELKKLKKKLQLERGRGEGEEGRGTCRSGGDRDRRIV